jgi:hypothetical protein
MDRPNVARVYFAATALAVVVGIVIAVYVAADDPGGFFGSPQGRIFNVFTFFTTQANLLVGVACVLLVVDPRRRSSAFGALWLAGLVGIIVTGIVYHTLLSHLYDRSGIDVVGDVIRHTVVPIAAVLGWLVLGPRGVMTWSAVRWSAAFPAAWGALTLVRGPIVDWYPYPFIDVIDLGYGRALLNGVGIVIGYLGLAATLRALDMRLTRPGMPETST